jgi:hypothetical protein
LGRVRKANWNDQKRIFFVRAESAGWRGRSDSGVTVLRDGGIRGGTSFFYFVGTYRRILSLLCGDVQHGS